MVHSWAGPSAVWLTVTESGSEPDEVAEIAFELELELLLELELESAFLIASLSVFIC